MYDWTNKIATLQRMSDRIKNFQPFNPCMIEQKKLATLQPIYDWTKTLANLQPMYDWTKNLQPFNPCMIEKNKKQKNNLQPFNPKEDDNIFAIIVIVQFNNKL